MHHLLPRGLTFGFLLIGLLANQSNAQDILSSTGVSTRSYNYVEVEYLTNVDQDTPFLINGLLDISRGFSITGRYTNQREQLVSDSASFSGEASTDLFTIGLLYHNRLFRLPNTDWFVEAGIGRLQLDVDTEAVQISQGINLVRLAGGVRQTLTERLEVEVSTNFLHAADTDVTNETQDLTVAARGVYRVTRNFDVALSLTEVPSVNIVGLGFRFTW